MHDLIRRSPSGPACLAGAQLLRLVSAHSESGSVELKAGSTGFDPTSTVLAEERFLLPTDLDRRRLAFCLWVTSRFEGFEPPGDYMGQAAIQMASSVTEDHLTLIQGDTMWFGRGAAGGQGLIVLSALFLPSEGRLKDSEGPLRIAVTGGAPAAACLGRATAVIQLFYGDPTVFAP